MLGPRMEILLAGREGGLWTKGFDGELADLIRETVGDRGGDVLTYKGPSGLPYYLPDSRVVDLQVLANLAHLRTVLARESALDRVLNLRGQGFEYLLINAATAAELNAMLNSTLTEITSHLELASFIKEHGSWKLYMLGPFQTTISQIKPTDWSVDERYTDASYSLRQYDSRAILSLDPKGAEGRVTMMSRNSTMKMSDFDYITVELQGTENARVMVRFFLESGHSFDVAHWEAPSAVASVQFDLTPYHEDRLRGDVYVALRSFDNASCRIQIDGVTFVKLGTRFEPDVDNTNDERSSMGAT